MELVVDLVRKLCELHERIKCVCVFSLLNAGPFTDVGPFSLNASFSFLLIFAPIVLQTELHINSRSQKVDDKCFLISLFYVTHKYSWEYTHIPERYAKSRHHQCLTDYSTKTTHADRMSQLPNFNYNKTHKYIQLTSYNTGQAVGQWTWNSHVLKHGYMLFSYSTAGRLHSSMEDVTGQEQWQDSGLSAVMLAFGRRECSLALVKDRPQLSCSDQTHSQFSHNLRLVEYKYY